MRWTVWAAFGLTMLTPLTGAAQVPAHVRALDPVLSRLVARGIEGSSTFRELVTAIDASDSYVYIKRGDCRVGSVRSCFIAVTDARSARFMWVEINTRKADAIVVSWIGHELRHALEVIERPAIRTNGDFFFFYQRNGRHSTSDTVETRAAVDAGSKIRREVLDYERRGPR